MHDNTPEIDDTLLILRDKIVARIRTVYDPEIPVNLYDLGLIYRLDIKPANDDKFDLTIDMTLTSAGCPMADLLPAMVQKAVADLPELSSIKVQVVWDPPWTPDRMTDEARLALNIM